MLIQKYRTTLITHNILSYGLGSVACASRQISDLVNNLVSCISRIEKTRIETSREKLFS